MPGRTDSAQAFSAAYIQFLPELQRAAAEAEKLVASLLSAFLPEIHLISARAKSPDSALFKVLGKRYRNPLTELTDCIGVRIVTYYASSVDQIVDSLSAEFKIDKEKSVDRRRALDLRSFGYRSVHLIAKLTGFRATSPEYASLRERWFEIQVRSILEHAWSEIEHEVVYKSGISYPEHILRRFAAIAGTLELIEKEFQTLRDERDSLVQGYKRAYKTGKETRETLDTARLLGFMEAEWPKNPSWRQAESARRPFPPKMENMCIEALKDLKLCSAGILHRRFTSPHFKKALAKFASEEFLARDKVSHLALVLLVVGLEKPKVFRTYFPSMSDNPSIRAAISAARKRR